MKFTTTIQVIVGVLTLSAPLLHARLGDSPAQCDERYGKAAFTNTDENMEYRYYSSKTQGRGVVFLHSKSVIEVISYSMQSAVNENTLEDFTSMSVGYFNDQLSTVYSFTDEQIKALMPLQKQNVEDRQELDSEMVENGHVHASINIKIFEKENEADFYGYVIGSIAKPDLMAAFKLISKSRNLENKQKQNVQLASKNALTTSSQQEPSFPNQASSELGPRVKGLSIGMNVRSIPAWCKEKLGDSGEEYMETKNHGNPAILINCTMGMLGYAMVNSLSSYPSFDLPAFVSKVKAKLESQSEALEYIDTSLILSNEKGLVNEIMLNSKLVNYLFKSSDMEASEFAKQFIEAYKIPKMNVSDDGRSWNCTSPDGVKIIIDENKNIYLIKVQSHAEVKGSFD